FLSKVRWRVHYRTLMGFSGVSEAGFSGVTELLTRLKGKIPVQFSAKDLESIFQSQPLPLKGMGSTLLLAYPEPHQQRSELSREETIPKKAWKAKITCLTEFLIPAAPLYNQVPPLDAPSTLSFTSTPGVLNYILTYRLYIRTRDGEFRLKMQQRQTKIKECLGLREGRGMLILIKEVLYFSISTAPLRRII
ncbi:hypothetical protein BHE74_00022335, partial [Ensete ventricosum]